MPYLVGIFFMSGSQVSMPVQESNPGLGSRLIPAELGQRSHQRSRGVVAREPHFFSTWAARLAGRISIMVLLASLHGVVLVEAAGQGLSEHVLGQLVDTLDDLGHIILDFSAGEALELLSSFSSGSFSPIRACLCPQQSWFSQLRVGIHELLETDESCFQRQHHGHTWRTQWGERKYLQCCSWSSPSGMPASHHRTHQGHLGFNDAFSIFSTPVPRGEGGKGQSVYQPEPCQNLSSRISLQQLLDDIKLSHLHGVSVFLASISIPGETQLLLLQNIKDIIRDNTSHSTISSLPSWVPGKLMRQL